jgi:hypothetical protein
MNDTVEIVKSGAFDKAIDLLHKLAGPMFDEFGAMLGDNVRVYRVKNLIKTFQKTEQLLLDAGLLAKTVPPRLLLPIIENSSIEDNDSLQRLWAGLLATASQQADSVSPSFVETLKQLTPDEARHLEQVLKTIQESENQMPHANMPITPYAFTKRWDAPSGVSADTFERLGLIRRDFDVKLWSSSTSKRPPSDVEEAIGAIKPEMRYQFLLTKYAVSFLEACHGPCPSSSTEPTRDVKA